MLGRTDAFRGDGRARCSMSGGEVMIGLGYGKKAEEGASADVGSAFLSLSLCFTSVHKHHHILSYPESGHTVRQVSRQLAVIPSRCPYQHGPTRLSPLRIGNGSTKSFRVCLSTMVRHAIFVFGAS